MFKEHELYKFYVVFIDQRKISNGSKRLLKISESSFLDFVRKYETDDMFKYRINEMSKVEIRDEKIEDILDDDFFI